VVLDARDIVWVRRNDVNFLGPSHSEKDVFSFKFSMRLIVVRGVGIETESEIPWLRSGPRIAYCSSIEFEISGSSGGVVGEDPKGGSGGRRGTGEGKNVRGAEGIGVWFGSGGVGMVGNLGF
jgi:hypothetical protein